MVVYAIIADAINCMGQTHDASTASGVGSECLKGPQGCTNLKLRQLTRVMSAHYDTVVGVCGLKGTQYSLLSHVVKLGPLRPVGLAAVMKVSPSTLSRNLQSLMDAHWIERIPAPNGRGHWVQATDAGRVKREEAKALWRQAQEQVNQTLGLQGVADLHAMLDECMARMGASAPAEGG
jgi:DNA-binding MarR family transcriptional regulator